MVSRHLSLRLLKSPNHFFNKEFPSRLRKSLYLDFYKSNSLLLSFRLHLLSFSTWSSITKIRISCVCTGRTHAVYSKVSLSRFFFKKRLVQGLITGFKKSSW